MRPTYYNQLENKNVFLHRHKHTISTLKEAGGGEKKGIVPGRDYQRSFRSDNLKQHFWPLVTLCGRFLSNDIGLYPACLLGVLNWAVITTIVLKGQESNELSRLPDTTSYTVDGRKVAALPRIQHLKEAVCRARQAGRHVWQTARTCLFDFTFPYVLQGSHDFNFSHKTSCMCTPSANLHPSTD